MPENATESRKDAHLDLCVGGAVEPEGNDTLLGEVGLIHCALPELSLDEVDLTTRVLGRTLRAPFLVTGMTGGSTRAGELNRSLAAVAQREGIGFAVGSQRAMVERPALRESYDVRSVAPDALLLGNLGLQQAVVLGADACVALMGDIGADGMCLHLNPAQELAQPEGDRDFRHGLGLVEQLAARLGHRLVVKETGCGLSPRVARRLVDVGVKALDVSGLGGTSWVQVEALRSADREAQLAGLFAGWGIPTAASLASVREAVGPDVVLIASGGIRNAMDAARALALGADLVGVALPVLRAHARGGENAVSEVLWALREGLRRAVMLCGVRRFGALREQPRVIGPTLRAWMDALRIDGSTPRAEN